MKKVIGILLCAVFAMGLLSGCGGNDARQNAAMKKALMSLSELRNSSDGSEASILRGNIIKGLEDVKLKLSDIAVDKAELDSLVREAYFVESKYLWRSLKATHADTQSAENLRDKLFSVMPKAERYVASERTVSQIVARNYLEKASRQGIKLGPADYKAAGLKPYKVFVKKTKRAKAAGKKK
jgi:hypothetical protein